MLETISQYLNQFPGGDVVWMVLIFIAVFGVLVFFHEWGHYWAARSVGVKVETFSVGFGREIWGWFDRHGTRWKIAWVPLGGYVQMHGFQGDIDHPLDPRDQKAFAHKPVWARMWVVAAGPLANYLLAVICFTALLWVGQRVPAAQIGAVDPTLPAAAAGLQTGDMVKTVNGQAVVTWEDLQRQIGQAGTQPLTLVIERATGPVTLTVVPKVSVIQNMWGESLSRPVIGVSPGEAWVAVPHTLVEAIVGGVERTLDLTWLILTALGKIITGQMGGENIGGPILIAQQAAQSADQGWYPLVFFIALMSVNLGLINLLPIPVLDGGHLAQLAYEGVRGKPLSLKVQDVSMRLGGALLIGLMIFAFYNDIVRLIAG